MNKGKILLFSFIISVLANGEETAVKLDRTVIKSVTGFSANLRDIASTPKIITSEEIKNKQYSTIDEVLRNTSGVDIIYDSKGKPIVSLRGQGYDSSSNYRAENNVKIMIDGISCDTLDTKFGGTPISSIPMSTIERIEVIPGGGAVLYGSGTVGGIINVITKNQTGTRGNVDYKYGDASGHLTSVNAGHTIGKFDIDLTYSKEDGKGYRAHDETDADSFLGKLRYDISDTQKLEFKYTKISEKNKYPDALTGAQLEEDRTQSGIDTISPNLYKTDTKEYVLSYQNKLTNNFEFDITGYKKYMDTDNYTLSMGTISNSISENKKTGIKTKGKYTYGNGSSLILGIEYTKDEMYKSGSTSYDLSKKTIGVFALNNYKIKDNIDFISGIRYEKADYKVNRYSAGKKVADISPTEDEFAYELGINYLYSETGNMYFKYERAFLLPPVMTLTNKTQESITPSGTIIPEAYYYNNIKSEHSDTFEIGVKDFVGDTFLSAVVYYTITKDEITGSQPFYTKPSGGMGVYIDNYNIGETVRKGIELSAVHNLGKLDLRGSYNYVDAEIKKGRYSRLILDDTKMTNVVPHKFTIGADYRITDKILIMGDITYNAGIYTSNTTTKLGVSRGRQNEYTIANLKLKYEVYSGLNLYAGINNLFNEKYYDSITQNSLDYNDFYYSPASERNYYIGISYSF